MKVQMSFVFKVLGTFSLLQKLSPWPRLVPISRAEAEAALGAGPALAPPPALSPLGSQVKVPPSSGRQTRAPGKGSEGGQ